MIDIKCLRQDISFVASRLQTKGFALDVKLFDKLESERKTLQTKTEQLQAERNSISKKIGIAKSKQEDCQDMLQLMISVGKELEKAKKNLEEVATKLQDFLSAIPNMPDITVTTGKNELDNVELKRWGDIPEFDFVALNHVELGEKLGGLDFKSATKISGARFIVMKSGLARMHRALAQFMLDVHIKDHNYIEHYVPYLVNEASLFGTGQLPKFGADLFNTIPATEEKQGLSLIPTAEVSLTNMVRDSIMHHHDLPIKMVAHTPCFRSEAGSYGKDTKGLIRQHQFDKVELVQIVHPDHSMQALEQLTKDAETILELLRLPYRKMELCTGDLGFSSCKTYDLEVWLPSQKCYREISSCSNMSSFQACRMKSRFKDSAGKLHNVHTLNGSGLAVGRCLVAIMENYQKADGSIEIPEALRPYMNNAKVLDWQA